MRIDVTPDPTAADRDEITAFLATSGLPDHALGEVKRAQLATDDGAWSSVTARESDRIVGYAHVRWAASGDDPRATSEVVVGPASDDAESVAHRLLDEVRRLVAEAGGGTLYVWSHKVDDPHRTLSATAGFTVQRQLAVMSRPLTDQPAVADAPAGVTLQPFRPGFDDDEFLRVNNAAFEGHPEQGGWTVETLRTRQKRSWFDPSGLILAWEDERLLGFHWTKVHGGEPVTGEVYVLGVDPEAQGRGLGRVLLRAGFAHLYEQGCRDLILYVDSANTTAVRAYEAEGFTTDYLEVCYEDTVRPAGT